MLQPIILLFMLGFLFSNSGFAQFQVQKTEPSVAVDVFVDKDGEWIHWDSGESTQSVGTNTAIRFSVASRWLPEDLADYDGWEITQISFVPAYEDAVFTLKIWVGEGLSPDTVYSQPIPNPEIGEWNEVELDEPFTISADDGVWFGYSIDTQGGFPAGCDAGPQVAGQGNMILYDGASWRELTELHPALTYNWSIRAYIEPGEELPTSIGEVDTAEPINLFPNPASSILNISGEVKHLMVYDITGRILIKKYNTNMVDVSCLCNGLYIIRVTTPNGTEAHRFYLVK